MNHLFEQALANVEQGKDETIMAKAPLFLELLASFAGRRRPVILLARDSADLITRLKNLRFFARDQNLAIKTLPSDDRTVMHALATDPLLRMERMATRFMVAAGQKIDILLLSPESLLERCPNQNDLQKHAQILISGETIDRDHLIKSLMILGYTKVIHVIERGTFAVRGSIIDIFSNQEKRPIRIDLFGDQIESIKYFDENTQRSIAPLESIIIGGIKEIQLDQETKNLSHKKLVNIADILNFPTSKLNEKLRDIDNRIYFYGMEKLLPAFYDNLSSILELIILANTNNKLPHIIFDDKEIIFSNIKKFEEKIDNLYQQACLRGDLIFPKEEYFLSYDRLMALLSHFSSTNITSLSTDKEVKTFLCKDTNDIRQKILNASLATAKDEEPHLLKPLAQQLRELHAKKYLIIITVSSREHEQELKKLLIPFGINLSYLKNEFLHFKDGPNELFKPHIHAYTMASKNPLSYGAIFNFFNLALIAEDDIFGKRTKRKELSGKKQGFNTAISDLEVNDLAVHVDHGVGQFKGLVRLNLRGIDNDYILLIYANDEKLYLPVHRINLVKPYGGSIKDRPTRLDKLGSNAWLSKKKKVKEAVMAMAQDLLKLYAKREIVIRPPFIEPDAHYLEFEANFEFETTRDQQKAIDDVIADLQKNRPMDRLVCGDVGYGKTEVAMRASMLAVLSNRQVAILAPTTVLAQQHGINFNKRFKNTGVNISVLSRFQKTNEIKETLTKLRRKEVDIIIGTHRLLSPDVQFDDLGLIVIDEEQRFGIKAKEHLKKMRTKVDVLTMSATPIPRTMQMSYFGIRDLSIIETPPVDRRAIETQVSQFDDAIIKEAVERELSRDGQIYFVHNRVQTIDITADYLQKLVPNAKIGVAHGQMDEKNLEEIMLSFMAHKIDILVCTTIIETGIDVPSANTMFINDADDFGLSQLYQLRGRIGRSNEQAFACLLIKKKTEQLTPIAKTRLEILHKFSELGAGFHIAQHDLELRGAGDLLGQNQHGHMAAVGYDLYAELLREAIKELKGTKEEDAIEPEVILPISALIPQKYCPDLHERMTFYQRLASADSEAKVNSTILDLEEQYGEIPEEVLALKISTLIKLDLKKIFAIKLEMNKSKDSAAFITSISLSAKAPVDHKKLLALMNNIKEIRVTPQHKVIQTIGITNNNLFAILEASLKAIENIKTNLFIN
jgi:transcription-repair coupling factor (superfamily II helicase)